MPKDFMKYNKNGDILLANGSLGEQNGCDEIGVEKNIQVMDRMYKNMKPDSSNRTNYETNGNGDNIFVIDNDSSDDDAYYSQDLTPEKIKDIILGAVSFNCNNVMKGNHVPTSTRSYANDKLGTSNLSDQNHIDSMTITINSEPKYENGFYHEIEDDSNEPYAYDRSDYTNLKRLNGMQKVYKNPRLHKNTSLSHKTKHLNPSVARYGSTTEFFGFNDANTTNIDQGCSQKNSTSSDNIISAQLQQFECFEERTLKMSFGDFSDQCEEESDNERDIIVELHGKQNENVKQSHITNSCREVSEKKDNGVITFRNNLFLDSTKNHHKNKAKSDIQIRIDFQNIACNTSDKVYFNKKNNETEIWTNPSKNCDLVHDTEQNESEIDQSEISNTDYSTNDIFDYLKLDKRRPSEIKRDLENKVKNKKRRSLRVERLKQIQENTKELLKLRESRLTDECPNDLINESIIPVNNKIVCGEMPVLEPIVPEKKVHRLLLNKSSVKNTKNKKIDQNSQTDVEYSLKLSDTLSEKHFTRADFAQSTKISKRKDSSYLETNNIMEVDSNIQDPSKNEKSLSEVMTKLDDNDELTAGPSLRSHNLDNINKKNGDAKKEKISVNTKKLNRSQKKHYQIRCKTNILNNIRVTRNFRALRSRFIMDKRSVDTDKTRKNTNVVKKSRYKSICTKPNKCNIPVPLDQCKERKDVMRSVDLFDKFSSTVYCDILQQSSKLKHILDVMDDDKNQNIAESSPKKQKTTPTKIKDLSGELRLTTFENDQKPVYLDSGHESDIDDGSSRYRKQLITDHFDLAKATRYKITDIKNNISFGMPHLKNMTFCGKKYPKLELYTQSHNIIRYMDLNTNDNKYGIPHTLRSNDKKIKKTGNLIRQLTKPIKSLTNDVHSLENNDKICKKIYEEVCSGQKRDEELSLNNIVHEDVEDGIDAMHIKNNVVIIVRQRSIHFYEHSTGIKFFRSPKLWIHKGTLTRYLPGSEVRLEQVTNQITSSDGVTAYIELLIKTRKLSSSQKYSAVCDMSAVVYRYCTTTGKPSKTILHLDYPQCSMDHLVFTVLPSDRGIAVGYVCTMDDVPSFAIKKYLLPKHYAGDVDIITLPGIAFSCTNLQAVNADVILGYCPENVVLWHHGYEQILQTISLSSLPKSVVDRDLSSIFIKATTSRCVWAKWESSCSMGNALHMLIHNRTKNILMLLTAYGKNWTEFKIMHVFEIPDNLGRLITVSVGQYRVVASFTEGGISYDFPMLPIDEQDSNLLEECGANNVQIFESSVIYPCGEMVIYSKNGTAVPLTVEQL